jgi:hypothetical protein
LNDVDPLAWLTDVLERIVSGRTKQNLLTHFSQPILLGDRCPDQT